jgi:hypothetical protein
MAAMVLTTDDLREFKLELLDDIKKLISIGNGQVQKKWLKSPEVRKLLAISPGTLQNLRINRTLPFTKIGGVIYYSIDDINNIMTSNKVNIR